MDIPDLTPRNDWSWVNLFFLILSPCLSIDHYSWMFKGAWRPPLIFVAVVGLIRSAKPWTISFVTKSIKMDGWDVAPLWLPLSIPQIKSALSTSKSIDSGGMLEPASYISAALGHNGWLNSSMFKSSDSLNSDPYSRCVPFVVFDSVRLRSNLCNWRIELLWSSASVLCLNWNGLFAKSG